MNRPVRSRILRGIGAGSLGPVITAAFQIVSVPLFLYFWGPQLYGEWLILSAIPTYLRLSDIGLGDVSGSEMTMRVAAGDRRAALEVFQTTWVLTTCVSVMLGVAIGASVWFLPLNQWLHLTHLSHTQATATLLLFSVYVLVGMQGGPLLGGFMSEENLPTGLMWLNWIRLGEYAAATLTVCVGGGPAWVACAYLLSRTAGIVTFRVILKRSTPWLVCGMRFASVSCIRRLLRPAIAYTAFPAGNALSFQGMVILIGRLLGPTPVVVFSTLRTLSRVALQIMNVVKLSVWPEVSAAFGTRNYRLLRSFHQYACQASLVICGCTVPGLFLLGPMLFHYWTQGRVQFDPTTFHLLLLVVLSNSLWDTSSVVTMASNRHARIAAAYLLETLFALLLAYALVLPYGISGAAMALFVADAIFAAYVLKQSLKLIEDTGSNFARALLDVRGLLRAVASTPRHVPVEGLASLTSETRETGC